MTIWLIANGTAIAGLAVLSLSFVYLIFLWILNILRLSYLLLLLSYAGFAIYTEWFQITKGVEVIQTIQPEWEGTESGLLWPQLLYMVNLIDENDQPKYFGPFTI